jgi:hypothetical protein
VHATTPEYLLDDPESDLLGTSVLRTMSRSYRNQFSIGPIRAGLLALLTFGIVPLWRMRRAFRGFVTLEKQQLWHLGEWLRNRRGGEEAAAVADAVSRIGRRWWISALITICLIVMTASLVMGLLGFHQGLSGVIDRTYRFSVTGRDPKFFATWLLTLGIGFTLHFIGICLHALDVEKVAIRFNTLAMREGVTAVTLQRAPLGFSIGWAIVALAFVPAGALWAIPMALAGASQRRYVNMTSLGLREQLVDRLRAMLQQRRPAVAVPSFVIHGRRCGNVLCRAAVPIGARFCTRCGAAIGRLGEVA